MDNSANIVKGDMALILTDEFFMKLLDVDKLYGSNFNHGFKGFINTLVRRLKRVSSAARRIYHNILYVCKTRTRSQSTDDQANERTKPFACLACQHRVRLSAVTHRGRVLRGVKRSTSSNSLGCPKLTSAVP